MAEKENNKQESEEKVRLQKLSSRKKGSGQLQRLSKRTMYGPRKKPGLD